MQFEEPGWIEAVIVALGATGAAMWRFVTSLADMRKDVEHAHKRIDGLSKSIDGRFDELRRDVHEVGDKSEAGRARIEDKLDRLIERQMK